MDPSPLARPLPLVVGALAVARITRLITEDEILAPARARLPEGRWAGFIACPWCVSMWLAGGWVVLLTAAPRSAGALGAALAWSQVSGLLASVG